MATKTTNLGLNKPSQEDFYNVDDFNENFQKIDDFVIEPPKTLIYGEENVASNEQINSILSRWFSETEDKEMKNYILYVGNHDLILPGGLWFTTIYRVNSQYGTIFINKYGNPTTEIRVCSIFEGVLGNFEKITPSNMATASVE